MNSGEVFAVLAAPFFVLSIGSFWTAARADDGGNDEMRAWFWFWAWALLAFSVAFIGLGVVLS